MRLIYKVPIPQDDWDRYQLGGTSQDNRIASCGASVVDTQPLRASGKAAASGPDRQQKPCNLAERRRAGSSTRRPSVLHAATAPLYLVERLSSSIRPGGQTSKPTDRAEPENGRFGDGARKLASFGAPALAGAFGNTSTCGAGQAAKVVHGPYP